MTKYWFPIRNEINPQPRQGTTPNPFGSLQRELDRMFGRMLEDPWRGGTATAEKPWCGDFRSAKFQPDIDMVDEKTHFKITAELPGVASDDVSIEVHDGALIMKGEKKAEEVSEGEGFYRAERSFGAFQRVIPLPEDVDGASAEARFENGVLTVRLPKIAPKQAKKIEIK